VRILLQVLVWGGIDCRGGTLNVRGRGKGTRAARVGKKRKRRKKKKDHPEEGTNLKKLPVIGMGPSRGVEEKGFKGGSQEKNKKLLLVP